MNGELRRAARTVALFALVGGLGACSWFTDFKEQPKFDPWESPSDTIPMRGNPQNSVSVYGTAAPGYQYDRIATIGAVEAMAGIPNPTAADARSLHNGRMYYQINCAVCHGPGGKGDGPVAGKGIYPPPLVGASAEGRSDGYIFGIMRNGRGAMPSYNRIEELDRWDVVNYVRGLQGRYTVAIGPVGLPGETGDKVPGYSQMGPTRPSPYYHHAGSQADATRGLTATPAVAGNITPMGPTPAGALPTTPTPDSTTVAPRAGVVPVRPATPPSTTPKAGGAR
jgi:mono/diheme cytochrome c family protein